MHYANGREAKLGDTVIHSPQGKPELLGTLVEIQASSTSCNGRVIPKPYNAAYVTLRDCIHVDDVNRKPEGTPNGVIVLPPPLREGTAFNAAGEPIVSGNVVLTNSTLP